MQKYLIKSFKGLDIFGSDISLNYKNDNLFRTAFGGVVITLVSKTQITFIESVQYDTDPGVLQVGKQNFMIAVKNDQQNFISKPQYNITFEWRHYQRFQNGTYIQKKYPLQLEPCTIDHFSDIPSKQINWTQVFIEENINDFLCLKKGEVFNIGGAFSSNDFYHLRFSVVSCVNQTNWPSSTAWQPVCDTPQNIKASQSKSTRVNFLLTNMQLNPEKTQNHAQSFISSLIFSFQPQQMYTTANLNINQQIINTDQSLIPVSDINQESYTIYQNNDYTQSFQVGNFTNYCDIYFIRSFFTTTYNRQYLKVDEVISYIGGFCQIFLLISAIIVHFYNHYVYTFELANRLYDFDIKRKKKDQKKQNEQNKIEKYQINITEADQNQQMTTMADEQNKIMKSPFRPKIKDFQRIKSLNQDGRILTREDAGLIPLDQIQKMLEKQNVTNIIKNDNSKDKLQEQNKIIGLNPKEQNFKNKKFGDNLGLELNTKDNLLINNPDYTNHLEQQKENNNKQNLVQDNIFCKNNNQGFNQECELDIERLNENNTDIQTRKQTIVDQYMASPQLDRLNNQLLISDSNQLLQNNQNFLLEKTGNQNYSKLNKKRSTSSNLQINSSPTNQNTLLFNENFRSLTQQSNKITNPKTPQSSLKPIFGESEKKEFLDRELKFLLLRERSLHFNLKFFLNKITCGKFFNSDEIQLLNKAEYHIREDLDIFNILDRLKEIEKLKNLFFNPEQQTLFNFFPKPVISIDSQSDVIDRKALLTELEQNQKEKPLRKSTNKIRVSLKNIAIVSKAIAKFKSSTKKNQFSHYQKLYSCYEKLIEEDRNDQMNNKLIDLIGDEIKTIFQLARLMKKKSKGNLNQSFNSQLIYQNRQSQNIEASRFIKEKERQSTFAQNNQQTHSDQKSTYQNESIRNSDKIISEQKIQHTETPSKEQISESPQNKISNQEVQQDVIVFDLQEDDLSSIKEN
ncbi:transmembrane protein, putative (macronuclear) [Tetrahymena thermophila SB210]|uniref:Transmembrane protein, putative n=1 Tax=Tetrahymena thermophila (strain SB210) TaxID=312017 RepID=Q22F27_TETTS|nr:transmembrane protein, putative [Tetrahymena thermophila SB210]EAR83848.2 transmembrane protein, putative [Tetrahymena thermophila SB210]|eukprot:XP_001031511.2 transmembrane protein, putative [Tetrahymena thermophila SB210]